MNFNVNLISGSSDSFYIQFRLKNQNWNTDWDIIINIFDYIMITIIIMI